MNALQQALEALQNTIDCLMRETEKNDGPICDTIWYDDHTTLFDYINCEIAALRAQPTSPAKFHHQASHISPDYRDGWNAAIDAMGGTACQPDLESRDFYELMQAYRHDPVDAAKSFEAVKAWLCNPAYQWAQP